MDTTLIERLITETATLRRLRGLNELTGMSLDSLLSTEPASAPNLRHLRSAPIGPASLLGWVLLSHHEDFTATQLLRRLSVSMPRFPQKETGDGTLMAHASLIIAVLARADTLRRAEQLDIADDGHPQEGDGLTDEEITRILGRPELWDYQQSLATASRELSLPGRALMRGHPDCAARLQRLTNQPPSRPMGAQPSA